MTAGRDEDAMTWNGDDDPTLEVGPAPKPDAASLPAGWTTVGKGSEAPAEDADSSPDRPAVQPMGSALLVTLGVTGGVFLLYTIGWVIGGLRLEGTAQFLISPVAYQFGFWLAVAAPAAWFATVILLTRASRTWVRIAWLAAGIALLVPWPFIMTGAVGQ